MSSQQDVNQVPTTEATDAHNSAHQAVAVEPANANMDGADFSGVNAGATNADSVSKETTGQVFLSRKSANQDRAWQRLEAQIRKLDNLVSSCLEDAVPEPLVPDHVDIWGVPFSKLTLRDTLHFIDQLIAKGDPTFGITANLNYAMLADRMPDLREVNKQAAFITCDGMPMVWWSKWMRDPLPERVAGSELIYALSKWSAHRGHRMYFLGGAPGIAQKAADKLCERYPGLQIAGVESPPFRPLSDQELNELCGRVRDSQADIVLIAFGQPKGELWMAEHCQQLGAPVSIQLGASFDFVAGGVPRAPLWIQKIGMEWSYRLYQEPKRLLRRYLSNIGFLAKAVCREGFGFFRRT